MSGDAPNDRQFYGDIFAITLTKTAAVFVVIAVYYLIGVT
jgi:hypothetical protein